VVVAERRVMCCSLLAVKDMKLMLHCPGFLFPQHCYNTRTHTTCSYALATTADLLMTHGQTCAAWLLLFVMSTTPGP
jgi:hypothetical protein